jgi:hypothetical protein
VLLEIIIARRVCKASSCVGGETDYYFRRGIVPVVSLPEIILFHFHFLGLEERLDVFIICRDCLRKNNIRGFWVPENKRLSWGRERYGM